MDFFVTHEYENQILDDIKVINDTVVTPHSPVAATIREDIYMTKELQQVTAPKWPQCEPIHEKISWEEAQRILQDDIKWKMPPCRYQDEIQECYVKHLGWHTAGMQIADIYSLWSATNTIQMMSSYTRDVKEMSKFLGLGQKA